MYIVIDRFEENIVICEKDDRSIIKIERNKIPIHAKEGDVLWIDQDKIIVDEDETKRRKKEIEKIVGDLWE